MQMNSLGNFHRDTKHLLDSEASNCREGRNRLEISFMEKEGDDTMIGLLFSALENCNRSSSAEESTDSHFG